ncbi:type II secretion system protein GspL [Polaromonas sp. YR568]|uniref:type II secretion system protein GspL n=1 Tax=Polaromonas sp. YR568 TaxID=1855301 RepID=UPI00398C0E1A
MARVDLLRLMLPPARNFKSSPVRCAWRTPQGVWHSATFQDLSLAAASCRPRRIEACPHPADVSMAEIELPPLPARRLRAAVLGAVELMALASPEKLAVGFGPRSGKGTLAVAWMNADALSACLRELRQHGLPAHAMLPPPAFLPNPEDASSPEHTASAMLIDGWALVRTGVATGILHPVPMGSMNPVQAEARLRPLLPESLPLRWLPFDDAFDPGLGQAPAPWSGTGWSWTLPMGKSPAHGMDHPWLRPAIGWAAATAAVCLLGLNLHASRVAAQGQALTRQMAAQVKAAFPEVSVVLNPLQQARQLRDARKTGGVVVESADFAALVRASAGLLPRAQGQVQSLDFRDGQLHIRWREGAMLSADEIKALQAQAQALGLAVQFEDGGLRMQAASGIRSDKAAPPARAAASGAAP